MSTVHRWHACGEARQPHNLTVTREICFLSMDHLTGYVSDDELAIEPLKKLGWDVTTLSWRQTVRSWDDFEAVVIRTPWDYQESPDEFLAVLDEIEKSSARLENPLSIVRWNLDKGYLGEMESRGCRIVPTIWDGACAPDELARWQDHFGVRELIIKPTVSGTAMHTYRMSVLDPVLEDVFKTRRFMVQPFMPNIIAEGEYSLFYFNGGFSHAINKSPKPADFRVQEEHGGIITSVVPSNNLRRVSDQVLATIGEPLLYARVDFVRDDEGKFCLMELELIEPALYLRTDPRAPAAFANAINTCLTA